MTNSNTEGDEGDNGESVGPGHAELWKVANYICEFEGAVKEPGEDPPIERLSRIRRRLESELADREGLEVPRNDG